MGLLSVGHSWSQPFCHTSVNTFLIFLSRLLQDQDPQKALDPFDEDSDAKLTAIARKFEEKYVSLHLHHLRAKTCDLLRMRKRVDLTFDPGDFYCYRARRKGKE